MSSPNHSGLTYLKISLSFNQNIFKLISYMGVPKKESMRYNKKMKCKNCKKEDKQIKAGKTYTPNPKERNYSEEIKRQAIKLYMEWNSGRAVGRILGISKNTCLYWIRKYAKKIEEKNVSNERVKVIEMDELYTYTERKKQNLRDNTSK